MKLPGVLTEQHEELFRKSERYAQVAGIAQRYIWEPAKLSQKEADWLKDWFVPEWQHTFPRDTLVTYLGDFPFSDVERMARLCGCLMRNFAYGWVRTTLDIVQVLKKAAVDDTENLLRPSVLMIPGLFIDKSLMARNWEHDQIWRVIQKRQARCLATAVGVSELAGFEDVFGKGARRSLERDGLIWTWETLGTDTVSL